MRIVYYRDIIKGTITHHHPVRDDMTDEQLNQEISKFNAASKGGTKAALVIVEPGSFEEYLLEQVKKAKQRAVEDIRAALEAIDTAKDAIQDLEGV